MRVLVFVGFVCSEARSEIPAVVLNNGVEMPRVAVFPVKVDESGSLVGTLVGTVLDAGFTNIFTAEDYELNDKIKAGLEGRSRSSYFLTSMTPPCIHTAWPVRNVTDPQACYNMTVMDFQAQLDGLGVDAVDLMMLHAPSNDTCDHPDLNLAQWRAYSDMYKVGKAKAIGVSNYCQSCLEPLIADLETPVPAVDQLQFHIGMGPDPEGLPSYLQDHGIALQAYSPLASGNLVKNTDAVNIGSVHNRSGAQTALRWITQHGQNFVVRASSIKHLGEDADTFAWNLTASELAQLDSLSCATNPELCQEQSGRVGWGCTQYDAVAV